MVSIPVNAPLCPPGPERPRHPAYQQTARFLQAIGIDVGPQRGDLDEIVLRTASADAFGIPGERRKRRDRAEKIAVFERHEATRQKVRAGRVALLSCQLVDLASTGIKTGVIADMVRQKLRIAV